MNYGLRYTIALIIGGFIALIWIWIFTPSPHFSQEFYNALLYDHNIKTQNLGVIKYITQYKIVFYLPHLIIFWAYFKLRHNVGIIWDIFNKYGIKIFNLAVQDFTSELKADGVWDDIKNAAKNHWIISIIVGVILIFFIFGILSFLLDILLGIFRFFSSDRVGSEIFWTYTKTLVIPVFIVGLPLAYIRLKEEIATHPRYRRWFAFSKGGSARWAGIRHYRKNLFTFLYSPVFSSPPDERAGYVSEAIYFGKTLFEDTFRSKHIGIKDDGHLLTVGCIGSGKSATALWSNLVMYSGSMLIIDPKGEHAKKTFWRRADKYLNPQDEEVKTKFHLLSTSKSMLLDPFNHTSDLPKSSYNPLSDIDIESDHARKLLSYISDACVLQEGAKNQHFVDTASLLLEGVIAHVLSKYPKENQNLPFVCDLLIGLDSEIGVADPEKFENLLIEMRMNNVAGGIAQIAASRLDEMGANERGSVLSTLGRSIKWITDPPMRKHLSESDISLKVLKEIDTSGVIYPTRYTIYVVLPFDYMEVQSRWLRLITNIGLGLVQTASEPPSPPVLFVLDEFPMMGGKLKRIEEGVVTLRGAGVKFWIIVQNIGQLKRDYEKNWETFVSSSTVQLFGVKDLDTAQWASEMLGEFMSVRTEKNGWVKKRIVSENARKLATPPEIIEELGKSSPMQYVFPMTGLPMRLHRLAYKSIEIDGNHFKGLPLEGHFEE